MALQRMTLVFAAALVAATLAEIEYYQEIGAPPDGYDLPEHLKQLLKNQHQPMRQDTMEPKPKPHRTHAPHPNYGRPPYNYGGFPKVPYYFAGYQEVQAPRAEPPEPEFNYRMDPKKTSGEGVAFAVRPVDPGYFQQVSRATAKPDLKRDVKEQSTNPKLVSQKLSYYDNDNGYYASDDFENSFEEPRQQRQNPNLASTKINKFTYNQDNIQPISHKIQSNPKFNVDRDIPTSLVPTSPRHQHVIQQALKNTPGYQKDTNVYLIYMYAMVAGIGAAATIAIGAFAIGWYIMRKKSKAALDVEYPAYGITGPNTDITPSGDRQLAHSAQMYHYQHQKQQIIAMKGRTGENINERNGSVSDAESEDENDEGDYTVYECPGFATTGEMEVKNPLFLDEPTPATPAQQATTQPAPKEK